MNALELVPMLSRDAWVILGIFFVIAVGVAVAMCLAEHYATQWQGDQYDHWQAPATGTSPRRQLGGRVVPEQRRPGGAS